MLSKDRKLLGLGSRVSKADVKARWRKLVAQLHPDHGGDADTFIAACEAFGRAYAAAPECAVCNDKGFITSESISFGYFSPSVAKCQCQIKKGKDHG